LPQGAPHATRKANNLEDVFTETPKDIYFAEKQILGAPPKMAKEAASPELKEALETHRNETEGQVERLNQIFESLGRPARGKTCDAILGIIDETKEIIEDFKAADALDAASPQVRHAENWSNELGMPDAAKLLDETLQEGIKTDKLLSKLATSNVNKKPA
jgi:ferritin-like metal-binding protein YciE